MARPNRLLLNLIAELRRQVERCYQPGEMLASQRELAQLHGTTHSTVRRALMALERERRVEACPRVGWRRAPNAQAKAARAQSLKRLRVGLISRRVRAGWPEIELLRGLLREASAAGIDLVEVPNLRRSTSTRSRARVDLANVPWNTFDVALLAEIEEPLTLADPLLRRHRVLSVDQDSTYFGLDSIAFANWEAGAQAARMLFELGHRRFAVTEEANQEGWVCDPSWTARRQGFECMLSWLGGIVRPEWRVPVKRAGWRPARQIASVVGPWSAETADKRPSALFAIEGASLDALLGACAEHRLRIPHDLSVIGVGGAPADALRGGMRVSHFFFDTDALARKTFDLARMLAADAAYFDAPRREPRCVSIPGKWVAGETVRAVTPIAPG